MSLVSPSNWRPRGVDSIEPIADQVVRSDTNALVIAGPGAGKTELLAQRACYLLETGTCRHPRRILAISFKRDAARNLAERVESRCGELARRFDSFTLDGFGKSLVDRFGRALPDAWRPHEGYEVVAAPKPKEMKRWLETIAIPDELPQIDLAGMSNDQVVSLFDQSAFGVELPYDQPSLNALVRFLGNTWWRQHLRRRDASSVMMFPMLNRLGAYLFRQNPILAAAVRATYSHVFMDEFQDTTPSQFDLVRTLFRRSTAIVTAVGDSKQRIMGWAGAMKDAFVRFRQDFAATEHRLLRNYRSAPELVRIQDRIASAIESGSPAAEPAQRRVTKGICYIAEFQSPEQEAAYLADHIAGDIGRGTLKPRDICVLARQKTGEMVAALVKALGAKGVRLRDETELQDLLAEPLSNIVLPVLRLASRPRDPKAWHTLTWELARINGSELDLDSTGAEQQAVRLIRLVRDAVPDREPLENLPAHVVSHIGAGRIRAVYRQYANPKYLEERVADLGDALKLTGVNDLKAAVDELIGEEIIPAMSIHKSKGLEFQTVIFLGLEDAQHWNFVNQSDEEIRSFFVAFSRAISRVIFTFSDVRDGTFGRKRQSREAIWSLYSLLKAGGVQLFNCRTFGRNW